MGSVNGILKGMKHHTRIIRMMQGFALVVLVVYIIVSVATSTRNQSIDTAIKAELASAIAEAELYYDGTGSATYEGVCADKGLHTIGRRIHAAEQKYSKQTTVFSDEEPSPWNRAQCHDGNQAWVAWVPLTSSREGRVLAWCTDTVNGAKQTSAVLPAGALSCP